MLLRRLLRLRLLRLRLLLVLLLKLLLVLRVLLRDVRSNIAISAVSGRGGWSLGCRSRL
jgi:hypothetical protein